MGEIKISSLVELTSAANSDELIINDISEPLDVDKTKRIKVSNLVKGLSCYGAFTPGTASSLSQTSWTDVTGTSIDISVPVTSLLVAVASFHLIKSTDGSIYVRWMLDGTAQPQTKLEYHVGSVDHPASIIGIKANVPSGTRTCKLQYYVTAATGSIVDIIGFVLGFGE